MAKAKTKDDKVPTEKPKKLSEAKPEDLKPGAVFEAGDRAETLGASCSPKSEYQIIQGKTFSALKQEMSHWHVVNFGPLFEGKGKYWFQVFMGYRTSPSPKAKGVSRVRRKPRGMSPVQRAPTPKPPGPQTTGVIPGYIPPDMR